jgi:hypothetical protein
LKKYNLAIRLQSVKLRKLAKLAALCIGTLFIISMLSVFVMTAVQATTYGPSTPTPTPTSTPTKISIVSASASSYNGITYGAQNAIDGIESTSNFWGTWAGLGLPQWLQLDFGSTTNIGKIVTHFYDADSRVYTYHIDVSSNGASWTTIVSTKTGSGSVADTFPTATGRYVRITITGNTANNAAHIEEIKIYKSTTPPTPTPTLTPKPTSTSTPTRTPTPTPSSTSTLLPSPTPTPRTLIGIYSNQACTVRAPSISWGTLSPGATSTLVLYVKNQGNTPVILSIGMSNWNPVNLSTYLTLKWNYLNQELNPGSILKITLTLTVSPSTPVMSNFGFSTTITATAS